MSNKLSDLGKSLNLAAAIDMIKMSAMEVDEEYLKHCIDTFRKQASFEDSAAVLNPRYNPDKSSLLNIQADTMQHLLSFVEGLKKCQELKDKVAHGDALREDIQKLFW